MSKKYGISFSFWRLIGVSAIKQKISKKTGFPLTKKGMNEKIGRKIRDAEIKKIPFMIIIGEKEVNEKTLSIRRHGRGDLGEFNVAKFCALIQKEVQETLATF